MNYIQWIAAFIVFNFGVFVGYVYGYHISRAEFFYRGKNAALREIRAMESQKWDYK